MITYREYQEKEPKLNMNIKENNINTNRNSQESNNNSNEIKNNNRNNSSNGSYTRSNKIEKEIEKKLDHNNNIDIEIHSNNMNDNNNIINQNNNIYNNPIKRQPEIEKNNENEEKKDIIEQLIEKIRNKQNIGLDKKIPRKTLSELDAELKVGLDQLRKIQTKSGKTLVFDAQKGTIVKYTGRNSLKFNEVMVELIKSNMASSKSRNSRNIKDAFFSLKNIKIAKPNIYFHSLNKNDKTIRKNKRKTENKFYLSSIDGNAIINGERKNPMDTFQILMKKMKNPRNRNIFINDNLNLRRNSSIELGTKRTKNSYPFFGLRKINNYNKNYFLDELNKISNLLL